MSEEKKQTMRPIHDIVMVKRDATEKVSAGGILIPDSAQEKTVTGVVIAAGPGRWIDGKFIETTVKKGLRVLFGRYSGQDDRGQQDVVFLRDGEILGVFE